jgi:proline iminopeptidase
MRGLYPEIEPYDHGRLRVSDLHELYYEQAGNPQGKPAIFLHGGPGAGIIPQYRQLFDPEKYRIVLLDQRGCGQSTPRNELRENTTRHIVEDLEKLREHLRIDKWLVSGGSWGGTLGLAYAQSHPDSISQVILRGLTPWRKRDMDWETNGARMVWPEVHQRFMDFLPENQRVDAMAAYYQLLQSDDATIQRQAALRWGEWEAVKCVLVPEWDENSEWAQAYVDGLALMEAHYCANGAFLDYDGQLLEEVHKMAHLPGTIICGRYDMICPIEGSWEVSQRWPKAEFKVVPMGGHMVLEEEILHEMITAADKYAE